MRLNDYAGAAIATGLFLMAVIGYRDSVRDDFVAEFNVPRALPAPPPPDPDAIPAFPDAFGWGSMAMQRCRDSVVNGSWDLKVWTVRPATYDSAVNSGEADGGIHSILNDSISDTAFDIIQFTQGGMVNIRAPALQPGEIYNVKIESDCVYMTGAPAQGDGVVLRQPYSDGSRSVKVRIGSDGNVHDVVMRDLRVWGDTAFGTETTPFYSLRGSSRVYIDHLSIHGGGDDHSMDSDSMTLAYSIVANQSNGLGSTWTPTLFLRQWRPDVDGTPQAKQIGQSMIRNYFTTPSWRLPSLKADSASVASYDSIADWEVVNHIAYHSGTGQSRLAETGGPVEVDWINTILATARDENEPLGYMPLRHWECRKENDSAGCPTLGWNGAGRLYTSGTEYWEEGVKQGEDWAIYRTYADQPIPDSIKRASRITQPTDSVIPWTVAQTYDSLISLSPRVMVGAGRRLTCAGQYEANRDSTDALQIWHFINSDSTSVESVADSAWASAHVYRDTAVVTAPCADFDSDGLPDDYEKLVMGATDSTGLKADSIAPNMGYFAIEMYLDGRDFNASAEGGVEPVPPTWGDGRIAYLLPVVQETVITRDTAPGGAVVDTFIRLAPDSDSIDSGTRYRAILVASRGSTMILTYDTLTLGAGARDSAAVDSILADMGITYPPYPWSVSVPGEP